MSTLSLYARATETEVRITLARNGDSFDCVARRSHLMEWVIEDLAGRGDDALGRAAARVAVVLGEAVDEVELGHAMGVGLPHESQKDVP